MQITVSKTSYPNIYRCFDIVFRAQPPGFGSTPEEPVLDGEFSSQEIEKAEKLLYSFTSEQELENFLFDDDVDTIIEKSIPTLRPLFPLLNSYFNWY